MKKKASNKNAQIYIIFVFYILVGAICGFLILRFTDGLAEKNISSTQLLFSIGLMFISMYIAMFLQVIIHESGHLVFGLFTGYTFSSFRIGSFTIIKHENKLRIKRVSIAGTGGQCLMGPPKATNGHIPYVLYNLGGCIFNSIASVIVLLYCIFFGGNIFLYMFVLFGFAAALINGIPLPAGHVNNDGKNIISFKKDPLALKAFIAQLNIYAEASKGTRLKDIPDELFDFSEFNGSSDPITATISVFAENRLMDQMKFNEAYELANRLCNSESELFGVHKGLLTCDRIYCAILFNEDQETINALLTKEQKAFMSSMRNDISVLRTNYLYTLLVEKNLLKAIKIRESFDKRCKRHPLKIDVECEKELIEHMIKTKEI